MTTTAEQKTAQTEERQPGDELPPAIRDAIGEYADAEFAAGEWTSDDDEPYAVLRERVLSARAALDRAILDAIRRPPPASEAITLTLDGDQWCALLGADLQEGVAGFGPTRAEAAQAFAVALAEHEGTPLGHMLPSATPVEREAARWRALLASDRIRVLGYAKADTPHMHVGLELWITHPDRELPANAQNRELLTRYADAAIARATESAAESRHGD